ncbi:hypothetical protein MC885_005989 [Smutsia gigantea]|nr:hypothetical protein MC885_005989 [Smutsia gigantea]
MESIPSTGLSLLLCKTGCGVARRPCGSLPLPCSGRLHSPGRRTPAHRRVPDPAELRNRQGQDHRRLSAAGQMPAGGESRGPRGHPGRSDLSPPTDVIHTVGPIAHGEPSANQAAELRSCYLNSLDLLLEHRLRSAAFPCISTGVFGYPNEAAAEVVLAALREWLEQHKDKVDRLIICVFLEKDENVYRQRLPHYFPVGTYSTVPVPVPLPLPHPPRGRLSLFSAFQPDGTTHPDQDW